jgi:hypothetical protein
MHFYDFTSQREVHIEGHNQPGWNTWERANEGGENPSLNQKETMEKGSKEGVLAPMMRKLELLLNNMANNTLQKKER